jgi:hypothetical protein
MIGLLHAFLSRAVRFPWQVCNRRAPRLPILSCRKRAVRQIKRALPQLVVVALDPMRATDTMACSQPTEAWTTMKRSRSSAGLQ